MSEKTGGDEVLSKALGLAVAVGALAVGVATAVMNNERARQMREELKVRVDELGRRVDELSAQAGQRASELSSQAQRTLEERRPDIESTIQKGREAVIEGLDKARVAVEQGADKAQEYVQRVGSQTAGKSSDTTGADAADVAAQPGETPGDHSHNGWTGTDTVKIGDNLAGGGASSSMDASPAVKDWAGEAGHELSAVLDEEGGEAGGYGDRPTGYIGDQFDTAGDGADMFGVAEEGDAQTNTGMAMQDAMSDVGGTSNDDLSRGSDGGTASGEDMSGRGDFVERDAEQTGYQLQGYMHAHEAGDSVGEAGEPGASEFGGESDSGDSLTQGAMDLGEPATLHSINPDADLETDNEPPRPGKTDSMGGSMQ